MHSAKFQARGLSWSGSCEETSRDSGAMCDVILVVQYGAMCDVILRPGVRGVRGYEPSFYKGHSDSRYYYFCELM